MRRSVIQTGFWIFLVVFVSWAFFSLLRSFVEPILWAVTLAIVFHPLFRRLRDRFGGKESLAATLTTFIIFFAVLLPIAGILAAMVNEGLYLYEEARSGKVQVLVQQLQGRLPRLQALLTEYGIDMTQVQARLQGSVASAGQYVAGSVGSALSNVAGILVSFFIMLYLVYFFLKDGYRILGSMIKAMPLGDEHEWRLLASFGSTARATIKGSVVVGAIQGLIGGIAFAALGVHGPIFWGVMMAVASLIPSVGTALIWAPAALYFFATGEMTKAIVLVVVGGGLISMVDNVLRPLLVGRDTGVPDWIVLLVSFGGIALFGLSGIVIGPIVAALFLTVWEQFAREFDYGEDDGAGHMAPAPERRAREVSPAASRAVARALEAASAAEAAAMATAQAVLGDDAPPDGAPSDTTTSDDAAASLAFASDAASGAALAARSGADTATDAAENATDAATDATAAADKATDAAGNATAAADKATDAAGNATEAADEATEAADAATDAATEAADSAETATEFIRKRVEGDDAPEPKAD